MDQLKLWTLPRSLLLEERRVHPSVHVLLPPFPLRMMEEIKGRKGNLKKVVYFKFNFSDYVLIFMELEGMFCVI